MLKTKNVFVDTECFVRNGLNFDSSVLAAFKKLCATSKLNHITTSVVQREVNRKIEDSIKEALSGLKTFRKKAQPLNALHGTELKVLFNDLNETEIYKSAKQTYQTYLDDCLTDIAVADKIDGEDILDRYFETKAPFNKDKSNEFRDAISLASLKSHTGKEIVYVISGDQELEEYCDEDNSLIYIDTLPKLLDLHNETNIRTSKIKDYLAINLALITQRISDYIDGCDVYNVSTWEDAEVDSFSVQHVGIDEPSVISISDENCTVSIDAAIELEVYVTGPDYNNGTYDKEDGIIFTHGHATRVETIRCDYTVDLDIFYECLNDVIENVEIDVTIDEACGGIEVSVEENEDFYEY